MKFYQLLVLSCFFTLTINAQDAGSNNALRVHNAYRNIINKAQKGQVLTADKIVGSAYFKETFSLGKIYFEGKEIDKEHALRYNAYKDEIEVNNGVDVDVLFKSSKISCLIGDEKFICHPYVYKESTQLGYVKVLYKGDDFSILIRETKKFKQGKKARTTLTASHPPKLVSQRKLYISKNNKPAVELKQKKKALLAVIPPKYQQQMSDFLKTNRLNLKKTANLRTFFNYYQHISKL